MEGLLALAADRLRWNQEHGSRVRADKYALEKIEAALTPAPVKPVEPEPTLGQQIADAWGLSTFDAAGAIDKAIASAVAARDAAHAKELEVLRERCAHTSSPS